jgi:SAM-dependent methyltransferase
MRRIRRWLEFNRWYLQGWQPPWDTGVSPPELYAFIEGRTPGRALDLGCGTGTNAITLAQHGWQVVGVDFAIRAIGLARRKARAVRARADFRVGDVTRLGNLYGPFDLILDIGCFHGLATDERSAYAHNVKRWLDRDGVFLLYVIFKDGAQPRRSGVAESDLSCFAPELVQVARVDGRDAACGRPSAWLTYRFASQQELLQ